MTRTLLISLALLCSASQLAEAAECCGDRGDWAEELLWGIRNNFCSNPTSHEPNDGGFQSGSSTYLLWGRADGNKFNNCWDATAQIIEQCARKGFSVGSWQLLGEQYAISIASTGYRKKRSNLPPFPNVTFSSPTGDRYSAHATPFDSLLSDLKDGPYDVDGEAVDVQFENLDFLLNSFEKRDLPHADSGLVPDAIVAQRRTVNLKEAVMDAVRAARRANHRRELDQTCDVVNHYKYAMVELGHRRSDWQPASGEIMGCGVATCRLFRGDSVTWSESFSSSIEKEHKRAIADTATHLGLAWLESYSSSEDITCTWTQGRRSLVCEADRRGVPRRVCCQRLNLATRFCHWG